MNNLKFIINRLKNKAKDFTWDEMVRILIHFGYKEIPGSDTRQKFINRNQQLIVLQDSTPKVSLKMYELEQIYKILTEENLI